MTTKPAQIVFISIFILVLVLLLLVPSFSHTPARAEPDPSPQAVTIGEDNILLVNGKPFFPVGIYHAPTSAYPELKEWGFNSVHLPGLASSQTEADLDAADSHGLKVLFETSDTLRDNTNLDEIRTRVMQFREHPAVLVWYPIDEPAYSGCALENVTAVCNLIRELDNLHPIFILEPVPWVMEDYGRLSDILGSHSYPIPSDSIKKVAEAVETAKLAVQNAKPVWIGIQSHNLEHYGLVDNGRYPTPEEEKAMVYLALVHGAKGILYYSYGDMRAWPNWAEESNELWNSIKTINSEINELSPILLSGDVEQDVNVSPALQNGEGIHALLKKYEDEWYLLTVNSENRDIEATFTVPTNWPQKLISVYKEDRTIQIANNQFTDTFAGYEVHVYKIRDQNLPGDANGDGRVDGTDLELLKQDYLGIPTLTPTSGLTARILLYYRRII